MEIDGNEGTGTGEELTEATAAEMVLGLLSGDEDKDAPEPQSDDETSPVADDSTPEDSDETEQTEPEEEPAEGDEEQDDQPDPEPRTFRLKVDGAEVEVTEDELLKGYSRTADYTRKTQAIAAEKARIEKEELPALRAERQRYAEGLTQLKTVMQSMAPEEPDWEALRAQDPALFAETHAAWQIHQKRTEAVAAAEREANEQVQRDRQAQMQSYVEAQRAQLVEKLPEWKNPETAKKEKTEMVAFAHELGFSDEELAQVYDHRVLVLLRKAMMQSKAEKAKPAIKAKIEKVRAATPGAAASTRKPVTDVTKMRQRLAKTGSDSDAAALVELMLDDL